MAYKPETAASDHQRKIGWKEEEESLLWKEVEEAKAEGRPLKSVFSAVAQATGRKPNSIRNYYYARIKQGAVSGGKQAFVPFEKEQIWNLLVKVLEEQAKGVSVRACTLKMGNGDNKAMLRYQNKYRSVLKNNPELVMQVMKYMRENGIPYVDPYATRSKRGRHPAYTDVADTVSSLVQNMQTIDSKLVTSFLGSVQQLSELAVRGKETAVKQKQFDELKARLENEIVEKRKLSQLVEELKQEIATARDYIARQSSIENGQNENFNTILSMFRQLMQVNREFLGLNSVIKVSSLSDYISRLSQQMEDCEKLVVQVGG